MASTIANALKEQQPVFLMEMDFGGLVVRYGTRAVNFADRAFVGGVLEMGDIGASLDWSSLRYSAAPVGVTIDNGPGPDGLRFSDNEARQVSDRKICTVRIWAPGLSWSDIEKAGIVFRGAFRKESHDEAVYRFSIDPLGQTDVAMLPPAGAIDAVSWPDHRTSGGGGAVSGVLQPLIYGEATVTAPCVDTDDYVYLLAGCGLSSDTDDWDAERARIADKDGNPLDPTDFDVSGVDDGRGNVVTVATMAADYADAEPLTATVEGLAMTHPATIMRNVIGARSGLGAAGVDEESISLAEEALAELYFGSAVVSAVSATDYVDRLFYQACLARASRVGGGQGIVMLDPGAQPTVPMVIDMVFAEGSAALTKTPWELVCNHLIVEYAYNAATGIYEGAFTWHGRRGESGYRDVCGVSATEYGHTDAVTLQLRDVAEKQVAEMCAARYLDIFSHRHDLVAGAVSYADGWDLQRGQGVRLTVPEGPSFDGSGWSADPHILVERSFRADRVEVLLWRCAVNQD